MSDVPLIMCNVQPARCVFWTPRNSLEKIGLEKIITIIIIIVIIIIIIRGLEGASGGVRVARARAG